MTRTQKIIVTAYRYLAIVVLGAVLSTALAYAALTLFYTVNESWAAPVVISRTNEKILRLTAEVFRTRQAADGLDSAWKALSRESEALREQSRVFEQLVASAERAASQQQRADLQLSHQVEEIGTAKRGDIAKTRKVLSEISTLEDTIERDLQAGLMTREDAIRMRATINGYKTSATDATATAVALERQLSDLRRSATTLAGGPAQMPQALEVLARTAGYRMQLDNLRLKLQQNMQDTASKQREAQQLRQIVTTLSDSPYFRVTQADEPLFFAFVPYDNEAVAQPGQPVFDCILQVLLCSRVGTVTRVHRDEERAQHPLFKLETRGFLVELDLAAPQAAKSRVLFIGRAPMLF
ncbi:hypothetical protein [Acidovorax sp. sic0104]|uniref:hypothetical protein n=1 Tax=Acidovorax sp. sic0104 TaxID=2854784 RepID=UPI001C466807|nr:hypothetical protein [Acidovorax sp. sic0104]MBV7542976.1 hypothetical protein [Acidovorax sp. sic0104]